MSLFKKSLRKTEVHKGISDCLCRQLQKRALSGNLTEQIVAEELQQPTCVVEFLIALVTDFIEGDTTAIVQGLQRVIDSFVVNLPTGSFSCLAVTIKDAVRGTIERLILATGAVVLISGIILILIWYVNKEDKDYIILIIALIGWILLVITGLSAVGFVLESFLVDAEDQIDACFASIEASLPLIIDSVALAFAEATCAYFETVGIVIL